MRTRCYPNLQTSVIDSCPQRWNLMSLRFQSYPHTLNQCSCAHNNPALTCQEPTQEDCHTEAQRTTHWDNDTLMSALTDCSNCQCQMSITGGLITIHSPHSAADSKLTRRHTTTPDDTLVSRNHTRPQSPWQIPTNTGVSLLPVYLKAQPPSLAREGFRADTFITCTRLMAQVNLSNHRQLITVFRYWFLAPVSVV